MGHMISFSWTQTRTTTSTTTRGWSIWWRLGVWSATTTPYGMALWSLPLMPHSASTLGTTGTSCWSSTRLSLLTPELRSVCFQLAMASLSAVGSNEQPNWPYHISWKKQSKLVFLFFFFILCVFVFGRVVSCRQRWWLRIKKQIPY